MERPSPRRSTTPAGARSTPPRSAPRARASTSRSSAALSLIRSRLAVAAAALAAHATALAGGYTWLDHGDLESGAALAPPAGFIGLFAKGYARTGFYRPLTALA